MTLPLFLAISLMGGIGAALRLVADGIIQRWAHRRQRHHESSARFPVGTFVVNCSGSFGIGFVGALAASAILPSPVSQALTIGLLGGFTTFSTASVETLRLLRERRWGSTALNSIGMLLACVAAAATGLAFGSLL